jgi:hypothetical protein
MSDEIGSKTVLDLNEARKKMGQKPRQGAGKANTTSTKSRQDEAYARALKSQKGKSGSSYGSVKWYHYIQTIGLLLLVAWMMKSCQS